MTARQPLIEQVKLDKIVPGGQALGSLADQRKVFVWGALPGEIAQIRLIKVKNSYAEGVADKIIRPVSWRIPPRDECYLATSPWQIMNETSELKLKSQLVVESFRQQGVELPTKPIKGNNVFYNYRNKMEYSLWWDHDTARIWPAFHRRASHQKILVKQSSLEQPAVWAECQRVIEQLNHRHDQARRYQSLLVRCNQAGITSSGLLVMNQPHPSFTTLSDSLLGYRYTYSPGGFWQINLPVYEMALNEIKPFIETTKVVDMYAGVGTIGLSVARDNQLTLVETDKRAFRELENNLPTSQTNAKAIQSKSEEALEYINNDMTVIVDPPRAGLDSRVVGRILEVQPPTVIYLSCNPATQARDVAKLCRSYKIIHNQPFNFFPRTPHIENLLILEQKS